MGCRWKLLVLVTIATFLQTASSLPRNVECLFDTDCSQNYFCMSKSGKCIQCYDCTQYNRYPAQEQCARLPGDCGNCRDGFRWDCAEPAVLCNYCIKNIVSKMPTNEIGKDEEEMSFSYGMIGAIVGGVITLLALIFIIIYALRKPNCKDYVYFSVRTSVPETPPIVATEAEQNLLNGLPSYNQAVNAVPSYSEASTAPIQSPFNLMNSGNHEEEESTEGFVIGRKERETTQAAAVYRVPSCERRTNPAPVHDIEEPDSPHATEETDLIPPLEHDDDTLESNWTSQTVSHDDSLSSALSEARGVRLISQPGDEDSRDDPLPPPKRIRTQENIPSDASQNSIAARNAEHEKTAIILLNNASTSPSTSPTISTTNIENIRVDLNENIVNQSSSTGNERFRTNESPSEDEEPLRNSFNGNVVVYIQQNIKSRK